MVVVEADDSQFLGIGDVQEIGGSALEGEAMLGADLKAARRTSRQSVSKC